MPSVYHCSSINSTTFTTCCEVAVSEDFGCPLCGVEITPHGHNARFSTTYQHGNGNWFSNHKFDADVISGLRKRGHGDETDRRTAVIKRAIART